MSATAENAVNLGPHPQYPKSVKAGIPKLPDLKPGWKQQPIGKLFDVVTRPVDMQDETIYNLVTVKRSRGGVTKREELPGKKIAVKSQFYVESGDFLISKRQIVHGACGFVPAELSGSIVSNEYSVLHCKDIILPEFLNYLMHTPYFQQTCFHSSIGVHVEKMIFKLDDWFRWGIYLPHKEEQQKIASFLSSIDDKLNKLCRKLELLETYKRGLMHKIFSQEIRFRKDDGSNFHNWESKRLSDVGSIVTGSTPSTYKKEFYGVRRLFVSPSDINNSRFVTSSNTMLSDSGFSEAREIKKGSVLFVCIGSTIGKVAQAGVDCATNQQINSVTANSDGSNDFIYYLLSFNSSLINKLAGVQAIPLINKSDFSRLKFYFPERQEQNKISKCLASFDAKVEAVDKTIIQLKTFKKGLLQMLLV